MSAPTDQRDNTREDTPDEGVELTRRQAGWLIARVGVSVWVLWLVLSLAAITLFFVLTGMKPFVITSGSMSPLIQRGDIVLTITPPDDVVLSHPTVLTFTTPSGQVVTHRITGWDRAEGAYRTKGDANAEPDRWAIPPSDTIGVGRVLVPKLGLIKVWADEQAWVPLVLTLLALAGAGMGARSPRFRQAVATVDPDASEEMAADASVHERMFTARPPADGWRRSWFAATVAIAVTTLTLLVVWVTVASAAAFSTATVAPASSLSAAPTFGSEPVTGSTWYLRNTLAGGPTTTQATMPLTSAGTTTLPSGALPNYSTNVDTAPGRLLNISGTNSSAVWVTTPLTQPRTLSGTSTLTLDVQRFSPPTGSWAELTATLVRVPASGAPVPIGSATARTAAANPSGEGPNERLVFSIPTAGTLAAGDRLALQVTTTNRPVRLRYDVQTHPSALQLPQTLTVTAP